MTLDLRSNSPDALLQLKEKALAIVQHAVARENARWGSDKITVEIKLIGDRPAGATPQASTHRDRSPRRDGGRAGRADRICGIQHGFRTSPCRSAFRPSPSAAAAKAAASIRSPSGTGRQRASRAAERAADLADARRTGRGQHPVLPRRTER